MAQQKTKREKKKAPSGGKTKRESKWNTGGVTITKEKSKPKKYKPKKKLKPMKYKKYKKKEEIKPKGKRTVKKR
jgi:hypothetical protein